MKISCIGCALKCFKDTTCAGQLLLAHSFRDKQMSISQCLHTFNTHRLHCPMNEHSRLGEQQLYRDARLSFLQACPKYWDLWL